MTLTLTIAKPFKKMNDGEKKMSKEISQLCSQMTDFLK